MMRVFLDRGDGKSLIPKVDSVFNFEIKLIELCNKENLTYNNEKQLFEFIDAFEYDIDCIDGVRIANSFMKIFYL